jgi:hypothetical protein
MASLALSESGLPQDAVEALGAYAFGIGLLSCWVISIVSSEV